MAKIKVLTPPSPTGYVSLYEGGQYNKLSVTQRMDVNDPKVAAFKERLDELYNKSYEEAVAGVFGAGKKYRTEKAARHATNGVQRGKPPYEFELDDDGEETNIMKVKFSRTAGGKSRKTGKPWSATIDVFDASGKDITSSPPEVWSGSVLRVGAVLESYYTSEFGAGVSRKLQAVKILKLVSGGGHEEFDGMDEEEEGYTFDEKDARPAAEAVPAAASEGEGNPAPADTDDLADTSADGDF